jgi:hypothetical protein
MPKEAGNISISDQPLGRKEDLLWKTNRGLSFKKVRTILKSHSIGSSRTAIGRGNPLIFQPGYDRTILACHMQLPNHTKGTTEIRKSDRGRIGK